MKLSPKITRWLTGIALITALVGGGAYYYSKQHQSESGLVHYQRAQKELGTEHGCSTFLERKRAIVNYYISGEYEEDVKKVAKEARAYFATVPVQENSLVIFDIDDTMLYHYHTSYEFQFVWEHQPDLSRLRQPGRAPAIKPVLGLYKYLLNRCFKIILMTGRYEAQRNMTLYELKRAGYTGFVELIMMANNQAFDPDTKIGTWKAEKRKELAKKYNIEGNVGDRPSDFYDNYNGHVVKLPNYLY